MKLLHKYSRINLITSVIIFLLASSAFYFLLHFIFLKQLDDDLEVELNEITTFVKRNHSLPEIIPSNDEITSYAPTANGIASQQIRTVSITNGKETEDYRQLEFSVLVGNKAYRVFVSKSLENTDHIIRLVILVSAITILLLLIANFVINRIVLRRLWKPFYTTMKTMKSYRIGQKSFLELPHTDIEEFTELNDTLNITIKQSEREFQNLKEFTENASHEMQTPVAVIRSKMDVLIQDEHLSESQSRIIQEAYTAIQKLTKLNQALLLLSKIENRQFAEKENVLLHKLLDEKVNSFHEILQNKKLNISINSEDVTVYMNPVLADILFNNLLGNCIKHSKPGNSIHVALTKNTLILSNGPFDISLNPESIFTRFYKGGEDNDRHGLGLAIVKEICVVSGFVIEYQFEKNTHSFIIRFQDLLL